MRYCAYLRKSTDREDMQVDSIPLQEEWVKTISETLNKTVEKVYIDTASALIPNNRSDFTQLLKDLEKGKWDGVIVITLDRLARNMPEGGRICYALQTSKLNEIITAQGIYTPSSDTISMAVHFGQATQFSRNLSMKTKDGQNRKAQKRGKWMWVAPIGYKNTIDNKTREKFVEPDEMFPLMKKAFKLALSGKSRTEIWDIMYASGLRSKVTKKRPFPKKVARSTIFEVLKNPFYTGMVRDLKGNWYDGEHPAAVSKEDFDKLNSGGARNYVRSEKFHPFRSLIKCGECGCSITSMVQKGYTYYNCTKKRGACSQKYTREEVMDRKFESLMNDHELTNDIVKVVQKTILESSRVKSKIVKKSHAEIFRKLKELENEKVELVRMKGKKEISYSQMQKAQMKIEEEESSLTLQIGNNQKFTNQQVKSANEWLECLKSLSARYKEAQYVEKNKLIKMLGLNYVLEDGELACVRVNPAFSTAPKKGEIRIGVTSWN